MATTAAPIAAGATAAVRCRVSRLDRDDGAMATLLAQSAPRVLLATGDDWLVGAGVAIAIQATGPRRFAEARTAMAAARVSVSRDDDVPADLAPRFVGGWAFDDDHAATGAWSGFPALQWWLPATTFIKRPDGVFRIDAQVPDPVPAAPLGTIQPGPDPDPDTSPEHWHDAVTAAVTAILAGDVAKVVLARKRRAPALSDESATLAPLLAGAGTTFWFEPLPGHRLIGQTPETLVAKHGDQITTHALAGSAPRHTEPARDERTGKALLGSQKDILEHELVAAFIRERLAGLGMTPRQGPRGLLRLATVQHLETPIHCDDANGHHLLDIAAALHPTPAVAGSPRAASLDLIRRLESHRRGWYAGGIGWCDTTGNGAVNVALRLALATPETTLQFAGAGIVAGSNPDAEWDETDHKLAALAGALGVASRGATKS